MWLYLFHGSHTAEMPPPSSRLEGNVSATPSAYMSQKYTGTARHTKHNLQKVFADFEVQIRRCILEEQASQEMQVPTGHTQCTQG